ncbi:hypothetical protein LTR72_008945 [Exophiala xenobiotica]|nr:hypothetical protein LTR41_007272 [Exophiala xenobiotica]KAK5218342.1 hypothetical protein LTR72_008945 [Exophiala xenobiotica]KAK5283082.1 hypothetical protein LTR40_002288 [Exophiala xenobiotica]KAK5289993.1 hypothetical protein LTR14_007011 [Exophiala xenobiotica]KAK5369422.1 hypothetical protein LTS13_007143 [Exophiala xenobiotica]
MSERALPSRAAPGRSCVACRRRKIRCDRKQPCSYCTKLNLSCTYPGSDQDGKRARPQNDLLSRLERVESSLQRLESKGPAVESPHASEPASSSSHETGIARNRQRTPDPESGRLVLEEGDTRYVTTSFWTDLDNADKDTAARVDHPTTTEIDSVPSAESTNEAGRYQGFIFAFSSESVDLHELHPIEGRIFTLWQVFLENVDPLVKLIHVPTIQRQILHASQNLANIPPTFESLMFSMYYAAVTSVQCADTCQMLFQEERQTSLDRYRFGTEQALAKADFMSNPNVPTLQALTLYLICARPSADKTYMWSMTGLLIRLATKLGLHRDPVALGLHPFQSEIRRRLWWQILILDVRTAEDNDLDPLICEHSFDTKFPANVNDVDLDVNMTEAVTESENRTEMLYALTRLKVSYGARQLVFSPKFTADNGYPSLSSQEKIGMTESLLKEIEQKYLRDCDTTIPLCFLAATATRMILAKIKLTISHPARSSSGISQDRLQDLVGNSIEIVEYAHTLRCSEQYRRWVWLFQTYIAWDAVAFLLHSMNAGRIQSPTLLERAWKTINTFFGEWKDEVVEGDRRWRRLESLRAKAAARLTSQKLLSTTDGEVQVQLTTTSFERPPDISAPSIPMNLEEVTEVENFGAQPNPESEHHPAPAFANVQGEAATTGDYFDWSFDNAPYAMQGAPSWEMDIDEDAFDSWFERFGSSSPSFRTS